MKFIPYLDFPGNAEEAVHFYAKAFGGVETGMMRFGDMPDQTVPQALKDKVMHAEVHIGDMKLYFSDSPDPVRSGNNMTTLIECTSEEEIDRLYSALSEGGVVHMPLGNTFWGAKYANLTDRFGISWQLNFQLNQG